MYIVLVQLDPNGDRFPVSVVRDRPELSTRPYGRDNLGHVFASFAAAAAALAALAPGLEGYAGVGVAEAAIESV